MADMNIHTSNHGSWLGLLALLLLLGCDHTGDTADDDDATGPADDDDTTGADDDDTTAGDDDDDTGEECPEGLICVDSFPFFETNDTTASTSSQLDVYSCAPDLDESGPEVLYRVTLDRPGFLGVLIDDSAEGVDIDAHLLADLDPDTCLDRGHYDAGDVLDPGVYYVVADTYVEGGQELSGPYGITIGLAEASTGDCTMEVGEIERVGDGGDHLPMPATGPVVHEAHLVTVDDGYGTGANDPWPQTITENIDDHYALSQDDTGFVMHRDTSWCPQEGCDYGQAAYGAKLPVEDEAWYICMYWSSRPDPGTRMIVSDGSGRSLVAAAGYETGPGDLSNVAGVVEEVHHYFGTGHGDTLTVGFAVDQTLPLGPILCD
jgi:hypothetical protein